MGGFFSSDDRVSPEEKELRGRNASKEEFEGPSKNRSCTDVIWIFILAAFVVVFFCLFQHSVRSGDISRVINGYDNCGNICGKTNRPVTSSGFECTGQDMTNKRYLLIKGFSGQTVDPLNVNKECVTDCKDYPKYRKFLNRCIPEQGEDVVNYIFSNTGLKDFFHEVSEDLNLCWPQILYLCIFALIVSFVVLVLLKFLAKVVVWVVLLATVALSIAATIYLWIKWKSKSEMANISEVSSRTVSTYLALSIIATIATVCIVLVIFAMRSRIALVVQLFDEASRAITSMPLLLPLPILTYVSLAVVMALWIYFSLWIESAGVLTFKRPNFYYKKDTTMKVTRWYNLFGMFWFTQFCLGCQHTVIAGSVADWFFTRNKKDLKSPIQKSFWNLVRYHLGTIAFGSFLIALVQFIRVIIEFVHSKVKDPQNRVTKCIFRTCQCCLYCFEKFLTYLSRNAYIETAIYGSSFCQGGKQAFRLLTNNALRVAAINSIGDFVLFLGKTFVVIATVLLGSFLFEKIEGVQHMWIPLTIVGIFSYFIGHCFMSLYEMAIDTIFLCFCEDCEVNDGISKPYYMNKGLMEFVQNSKKCLSIGDAARD